MAVTRVATLEDAEELSALQRTNREFLAPWDPQRPEPFFTLEGQRAVLQRSLDGYAAGAAVPLVILDAGTIVGQLNINGIVRGALQSAALGYWVDAAHNGRGLATAAVADAVTLAFQGLGLHRLQAETLLHNVGSQHVLRRNGFTAFGIAPKYLRIAGRWQDCAMFYLLNPQADEPADGPDRP